VGVFQFGVGDFGSGVIGFQGSGGGLLVEVSLGVFGNVSVVISFHFKEEDFGLGVGGVFDEVGSDEVDDFVAVFGEFFFDFLFEVFEDLEVFRTFGFFSLFDGRDGSPSGSSGSDGVFVGDGEEISFFDGKFLVGVNDLSHVF